MESSSTELSPAAALFWATSKVRVGVAYCSYVPRFVRRHGQLVDFIELPFERLRAEPGCFAVARLRPVVLHSASLSIAGAVPTPPALSRDLADWALRSGTPWIGEHLSFVTALGTGSAVIDTGYSVSPPLNQETLSTVSRSVVEQAQLLGVPLLLENPPIYFRVPGSTMSQSAFLRQLCQRTDARLLLDLSHLLATACNSGTKPESMLSEIPLERVVEVHISGTAEEGDTLWDDHAVRASEHVFALLDLVAARTRFRAVTLEYNWSSRFPEAALVEDLARVRGILRKNRSL